MFGLDYAMRSIAQDLLNPLARNCNPVSRMVITGPAGVGKTLLVQWMSKQSDRVKYIDCKQYLGNRYEGLQAINHRIGLAKTEYKQDLGKCVFAFDNAEALFDDTRFLILFDNPGISIALVAGKLSSLHENIYTDERCAVLKIARPSKADSIKILESVTRDAENGFAQTVINILFDKKNIVQRLRIDDGRMVDLPLYAFNFISGRLLIEITQEARRIAENQRSGLSIDIAKIATENVLLRLTTITFKNIEEEVWGKEAQYIIRRIPAMNFE